MTLEELSRSLAISKSAVHQHLKALERAGYVAPSNPIKTGGRPSPRYVLTGKGIHLFPKRYSWFAELLLQRFLELLGREQVEAMLYRMGQEVAEQLEERLAGKEGEERLEAIVELMRELGYESRLEGGEVVAKNCVYHDLAARYPEVCALDLGLLDRLLKRRVHQRACMVRGGDACRFCPLGEEKG